MLSGNRHHFRAAPGHWPHIGVLHAVLFEHELLGLIDLDVIE